MAIPRTAVAEIISFAYIIRILSLAITYRNATRSCSIHRSLCGGIPWDTFPLEPFSHRVSICFPDRRRKTRYLGPGLHMDLLKAARCPHALNALHLRVLLVAPPDLLVRVSAVAAAEEGRVAEDSVHVLILQPHDTGVAVHCTEGGNQGHQHKHTPTWHVRPLSHLLPFW